MCRIPSRSEDAKALSYIRSHNLISTFIFAWKKGKRLLQVTDSPFETINKSRTSLCIWLPSLQQNVQSILRKKWDQQDWKDFQSLKPAKDLQGSEKYLWCVFGTILMGIIGTWNIINDLIEKIGYLHKIAWTCADLL